MHVPPLHASSIETRSQVPRWWSRHPLTRNGLLWWTEVGRHSRPATPLQEPSRQPVLRCCSGGTASTDAQKAGMAAQGRQARQHV